MKRLSQVNNPNGKRVDVKAINGPTYFGSKVLAKELRDRCNKASGPGHTIGRGPDHIGKHSGYGVPHMRRQPKK